MDIKDQVKNVAAQGRYGDTMLLHVNPIEVEALAKTMPITVNPETGQPEAFLPLLALAAPMIGSLAGPALFSALGATTLSPLIASALGAGLAQTAATGDVKKGLIAGLTGYGFGKLFQGASALGSKKDALTAATDTLTGGGLDATNLIKDTLVANPATDPSLLTTASQAAKDATIQGIGADAAKGITFGTNPAGQMTYTLPADPIATGNPLKEFGANLINKAASPFRSTPVFRLEDVTNVAGFQPADFATAGIDITAPSLLSSAGQDFATNVLSSPQNISGFAEGIANTAGEVTRNAFGLPMSQGPGIGQLYSNVPKAFQGEGLMGSLGVLKDAGAGALLPIGAGYGADYAYDMYKGPEGESFEDRIARERAENFAANPEPNIFYNEGGSTDLGERPKVFSPESILGFSGLSPLKSILDGDFKIPAGMFGLAGLAYDYFKNKDARNEYDAQMAALLEEDKTREPTALLDNRMMTMNMAEGGVTGAVGSVINPVASEVANVFGRPSMSLNRDIEDISDDEMIPFLGGSRISGKNFKEIFDPNKSDADTDEETEGKSPENIVARRTREIPQGFRAGIDPEFMYFQSPLNPSAAEVMGDSTAIRPDIAPITPTNTTSYGIPGVIDPYKGFSDQIISPESQMMSPADQMIDMPTQSQPEMRTTLAGTPIDPIGPINDIDMKKFFEQEDEFWKMYGQAQANKGQNSPMSAIPPIDLSGLVPNFGEGLGFNEGGDTDKKLPNKGLEALDKVAPEVVERMGFQEGDQTEIKPTMAQMQEAIPTDTANQMIDDPLTAELINYLLGKSFDDTVVERFTSKYGANAFAAVRDRALKTLVPNAQTTGKIEGSDNGGMADDIYGSMGNEKIAVSQGEFVLPADVVSGLGDGDTDSGSKELYAMMDRVRQKRTGKTQQPKPINPQELLPA